MNTPTGPAQLSAAEHAEIMADYIREGEAATHRLGNRGPIVLYSASW